MQFKIDLNHLKDLERYDKPAFEALQNFLNDPASPLVFYSSDFKEAGAYRYNPYRYEFKGISYSFTFKQTILKSARKSGKSANRFDYFQTSDSPYHAGGFGAVYPIQGTIKFTCNRLEQKTHVKKVVKYEHFKNSKRKENILREYNGLVQAGHIKVRSPVFNDNLTEHHSFLLMEQVDGVTLESLLHPFKRPRILSLKERIQLTFEILKAVQEQVVDRKLIHRDIKPGNIIINFAFSPPKVTIIDFGFNLKEGNQDKIKGGTRAYRSPESFDKFPIYSSKSDVWSAGRVLSYLWGDDYEYYYIPKDKGWEYVWQVVCRMNLFSEELLYLSLTSQDKEQIKSIIASMLSVSSVSRISILEAISAFNSIDFGKYVPKQADPNIDMDLFYEQIRQIELGLGQLQVKARNLSGRFFTNEADDMRALYHRLIKYTECVKENPNSLLIQRYKSACYEEIKQARIQFSQHRDVYWILGEISAFILLLGLGYALAFGINYNTTGRLGLFSQTKSDKVLEKTNEIIAKL